MTITTDRGIPRSVHEDRGGGISETRPLRELELCVEAQGNLILKGGEGHYCRICLPAFTCSSSVHIKYNTINWHQIFIDYTVSLASQVCVCGGGRRGEAGLC